MKLSKSKSVLLGAAISAVVAAGAVQAAETGKAPPRSSTDAAAPRTVSPAAVVWAQAPNARLAALIRYDGALIRQKGVSSVTRIDTGVFCILPTSASGITPSRAIVTLTPEYYYSKLNEVKVQWAVNGAGCGSNRIAVYTLADVNADGIYKFSDSVGFSIIVP
jgi:hypothetical protein